MKFIESQTYKNLARTYAGECQAHVRYKFIEYGARMQGYKALADLIDKIVYNEFNHARMFYTLLQENVKGQIDNIDIEAGYPFKERWELVDNLRLAIEDEENEAYDIYPEFASTAKKEGYPEIAKLYEDVIQVETCHVKLLTQLYEQLSTNTMYKKDKKVKWKCGDCGYEATSEEAWEECPLCRAKQGSILLQISNK